jgi:hypothetical protein
MFAELFLVLIVVVVVQLRGERFEQALPQPPA